MSVFTNMEEERIVEGLEGKLSNLAIKEENSEVQERTDDERVCELKARYNSLLMKAKEKSREGNLVKCLKLYKKAYKIHKSEKVAKRIEKLESVLQDCDSDDSTAANGRSEIADGFTVSDDIFNKLYPYQKEGVSWFWKLFQQKKGGILGDDMGLGKTIQVISFLSGMFEAEHIATVLIVMPVSLLNNWKKEFERWAPGIRVSSFYGSNQKQRLDVLYKTQSRNGVCLTTYGLVSTSHIHFSHDKYEREFTWDYIILDEGHKIKNTAIKTAKAIRNIPSLNHFILTGTPIQNNLREMWALFDFVCQGQLLGTSKSFKQEYENPIVRARERDATAYEKRIGQEMSSHLRELIAPHFLRRTKDILEDKPKTSSNQVDGDTPGNETADRNQGSEKSEEGKVAKLTRKNDLIIWLYLSDTQLQIYRDFLSLERVQEILMTTRSPLAELNVLKKVCDHPRLLSTMACHQLGLNEDQDDVDEVTELQWLAPPVEQLIQESGKMVFLVQLLRQLKQEGHRTLVFSQSRKMLDIIHKVLTDKGIRMMRIDGQVTSIVERENRIDTFQNDPSYSVFLLTTQVGGVGLTLTSADRVVIFDPSWNPATDAQAVDRVYRIGQKNTVVIYRLITCGSLEEKIYRKQVFKQAITKQTTGCSNNPYRYFSRHELRELFVLDDPKSSNTQIQLEKMHSANRVSDTKLDEHVAFLYSTEIFGISDHDLLFSEEAVATQEELHAASEMGDVIKAKVRRAADIMKSESSQATEKRGIQLLSNTPTVAKKSQTKISEHLELFIPSRQDNKRFMPKTNQPSWKADVIDITIVDNEMDEANKLGEQLSAINIDEEKSKRRVDLAVKEQIVLDSPENGTSQSLANGIAGEIDSHKIPFSEIESPLQKPMDNSKTNREADVINIATPNVIDDEISVSHSRERDISEKISMATVEDDDFQESISVNSVEDILESSSSNRYNSEIPTIPRRDDDDFQENILGNSVGDFQESSSSNRDDSEMPATPDNDFQENASEGSVRDVRGSSSSNSDNFETPTSLRKDDNDDDEFTFPGVDGLKGNLGNEAFSEESGAEGDSDFDYKTPLNNSSDDKTRRRKTTKGGIEDGKEDLARNKRNCATPDESQHSLCVDREAESGRKYRNADLYADSESSSSDSDQDSEVDNSITFEPPRRLDIQESVSVVADDDDGDKVFDGKESDKKKSPQFLISSDEDGVVVRGGGGKSRKKVAIVDSEDDEVIEVNEVKEKMDDGVESDTSVDREEGKVLDSEDDVEDIGDNEEGDITDDGAQDEDGVDSEEENRSIVDKEEECVAIVDNKGDDRINEDTESEEEEESEEESVAFVDDKGNDGITEYIEDEKEGDSEENDVITGDNEEKNGEIENDEGEIGSSEEKGKSTDSEEDEEEENDDTESIVEDDENGMVSEESRSEAKSDEEGSDEEDEKEIKEVKLIKESKNRRESSQSTKAVRKNPNQPLQVKTEDESDEESEKENLSLHDSPKKIDKRKVEKVIQPVSEKTPQGKTSCCPRGKHVSQHVDIHRCPCIMSSEEQEAYKMHVNTARRYEKSNQLHNALKHFMSAYKLCDSDEKLHLKLKKVYQAVQQNGKS